METETYYQYIRKLYTNNEQFQISELESKLMKHFRGTRPEVNAAIQRLISEKFIVLNGTSASINLLANPIRNKIYSIICKYPGSYVNSLKTLLNLDTHQLIWHLGVLIELELIEICEIGKIKAFGPKGTSREEVIIGCLLFKDSIRCIFEVLLTHVQGISQTTLAETTGMNRSTLAYIIDNLLHENLIEINKDQTNARVILKTNISELVRRRLALYEDILKNVK